MAFPTVMCAVSKKIHESQFEILDPGKLSTLPDMHRWVGSMCYFADVIEFTAEKNPQPCISNKFFERLVLYLEWLKIFIGQRAMDSNKDDEVREYNQVAGLTWLGRIIETYSVVTQLGWLNSQKDTPVLPGKVDPGLRNIISAHVGVNLWGQLRTVKRSAFKSEMMKSLESVLVAKKPFVANSAYGIL